MAEGHDAQVTKVVSPASDSECDPAELTRPLAIVRGAWDSLCTDADVAGLLAMATSAPERHDTRLDAGTHLMHLETGRRVLYEAVGQSLKGVQP